MLLNGKIRAFDLKSSNGEASSKLIETWTNKDYELTVVSCQTGQIDETWKSAGSLTITPNGKASTIITLVCECGW